MQKQHSLFSNNPITRAELNHQGQPVPRRRRWRRWFGWIGRAVTIFAYVFTFILVMSEVLIALLVNFDLLSGEALSGNGVVDFATSMGVLNLIPVTIVVVIHFRLMIQTLSRSSNSIARERQANNWDTLVLTGIDARTITQGKWWATVRHMGRPYLRLGIFRAAIIIGYAMYDTRPYYYGNQNLNRPDMIPPSVPHIIVALFFICALTFANLLFTAACGVSAFNKRSSIALARAIGTRLLIIIGVGAITFFVGWLLFRDAYTFGLVQQIGLYALITLFDNGVTMSGEIVTYHYNYSAYPDVPDTNLLWLPVFVALGVYALLTFLLLHLAQWQATRHNALPPLSSTSAKTT